jgi:hypothetical protein
VLGRWTLQQVRKIYMEGILIGDQGCRDRGKSHNHDDRDAEARAVVVQQPPALCFV